MWLSVCIVCTNTRGGCGKVVVCVYSLYKYKGRMWKGGCVCVAKLLTKAETLFTAHYWKSTILL